MLNAFWAVMNPLLTLFICMVIGFIIRKTEILPENSGKVMAKLETWIFCPALSFSTMANYFTVQSISVHATNLFISLFLLLIILTIAIPLSKCFVKEKSDERGIFAYSLAIANMGYMGEPMVISMFGEEMLSYYKIFCLPITILIYVWGISLLVPKTDSNPGINFKAIFNPSMIAMIIGIIFGISGFSKYIPTFTTSAINSLKSCMAPVAMLLAGFTVAGYSVREMLKNKKIYLVSILRLVIIPIVAIGTLFGIIELANSVLNFNISNIPLFLAFFVVATPCGLNTIIFPEAYGGNPKTGASMALISNILCVITIPVMYILMVVLFGNGISL